jgi:hypothetical protein
VVGEADGSVAGYLKGGVAGSVALESRVVAVEGEAVEFDDEALVGPERVDLETEDRRVEGGRRQLMRTAKAANSSSSGERVIVEALASVSRRRMGRRARRP